MNLCLSIRYANTVGGKNEKNFPINPKISRSLPGSWLENHPVPTRNIIFYHVLLTTVFVWRWHCTDTIRSYGIYIACTNLYLYLPISYPFVAENVYHRFR